MRTHEGETVQLQRFRDLLICLDLSMGIVTVFFSNVDAAKGLDRGYLELLGMEVRIKRFLGLRQTDLIEGHFAFWIPTIALSLVVWLILRTATRNGVARTTIPTVFGFTIFLMPTLIWLFDRPRDVMPPLSWPFWELVGCLLVAIWVRWRLSGRMLIVALGSFVVWGYLHYSTKLPGYFGPAGPILGFLASAAWTWDMAQRWTTTPKAVPAN